MKYRVVSFEDGVVYFSRVLPDGKTAPIIQRTTEEKFLTSVLERHVQIREGREYELPEAKASMLN